MNIFKTIYEETIKQLFYRLESNNNSISKSQHDEVLCVNDFFYKNKNMFNKFNYILNELLSVKKNGIHIDITDNKIHFSYIEDSVIELSINFMYCKENNTVNSSMVVYYTMIHSTIFSTNDARYLDDLSLEEWDTYRTKIMNMREKYILNKHEYGLLEVKDVLNISRNEKLNEMLDIMNSFDDNVDSKEE